MNLLIMTLIINYKPSPLDSVRDRESMGRWRRVEGTRGGLKDAGYLANPPQIRLCGRSTLASGADWRGAVGNRETYYTEVHCDVIHRVSP